MTDYLEGGEYLTPRTIHADRPSGELQIEWGDGHRTVYDFTTLRWLCPCAFCRGEAGQPGWLDSNPTLSEQQVTLSDISMVGQYAIQPTWADGHHTGYYTFVRLREDCPCPQDQERRAAKRADQEKSSSHQHG
ncbi:MAG: gamma-butyrobetaine hydroxylase-like domain-containing protein [Chloroflexota bacterium]